MSTTPAATPADDATAMADNPTLASLSDADRALHHSRMSLALAEADAALAEDEVPVGCAIVLASSGRVLATGRNQTNQTKNATRHCEFVALEQIYAAQRRHEPDFVGVRMEDCVLYVTVEPCIMCASALRLARIGLVVYGCGNDRFGGNGSVLPLHQCPSLDSNTAIAPPLQPPVANNDLTLLPPLLGAGYPSLSGVRAAEAIDVLKRFYARGNQNIPIEKRHRKGVAAAQQQQQQQQQPQEHAASAASATPVPSPAAATAALSTSTVVAASPSPAPSASPDASPTAVTPTSAAPSSSSSPPVVTAPNSSQAPPPLPAASASASASSSPATKAAAGGKAKGSPPAPTTAANTASVSARRAALKGEDAWKRMNFLYQSSHLLAVGGGMGAAGTALSRVYLMNMKKIATKLVMRLDPSVKNSVCKRCGSLLLPGHSADVRVESSGGVEAMVEIDECGEKEASSADAAAEVAAAASSTASAMQIDAPSEPNALSTVASCPALASEAAPAVAASAAAPPAAVDSEAPLPAAPSRKLRRRRRRAPGTHHRRSPLAVDPPRILLVCHTCGTSKRMHTKQYGASADS